MPSEILMDPLRGRTRLWRVFWLYGFAANVCYSVIVAALLPGSAITIRLVVLGV
jgi:hypothetical protein